MIVQGGRTKDFSEQSKQHLATVVEIFDVYTESWEQSKASGFTPSYGTYENAFTALRDDLFSFGGRGASGNLSNTLHRLDTQTLRWCQLSPQNAEGAPMPKYGCGMISFRDSLGVFGGQGIPRGPTKPQSFIRNSRHTDGRGFTNEFHIYQLNDGM